MLQQSPTAKFDTTQVKNDILSGLTVALALVPEAVAFAFIAGVDPVIGLYSAFFIGLITAIFGGRPGMISGATGAMAVVVIGLVAIHGVEYLFPTIILCGILQLIVGAARLGKTDSHGAASGDARVCKRTCDRHFLSPVRKLQRLQRNHRDA